MAEYKVPLETTATVYVTVEAESREAAIEAAGLEGAPGLMCLDHTYPDAGDWEVPEWYLNDEEENQL